MLALIPLRGSSKGIPDKNIKEINGKPLAMWVIEEAKKSQVFDRIVISTDSDKIKNVYKDYCEVIDRPAEYANDWTPTEAVMLHIAKLIDFKSICTIQATSPTTVAKDFILAKGMFERNKYDSLLTAIETKRFFWLGKKPVNYCIEARPMRQSMERLWMETGNFYMTERDLLMDRRCRLGGWIGIYPMSEENRYELDTEEDWKLVEEILRGRASG